MADQDSPQKQTKKQVRGIVPRITKPMSAYRLLSKICDLIIAEPKRYNQGQWISVQRKEDTFSGASFPACGTIGCVAGWVETLRSTPARVYRADMAPGADIGVIGKRARRSLGLTRGQAAELFDGEALRMERNTLRQLRGGCMADKSQPTPGPWRYEKQSDTPEFFVIAYTADQPEPNHREFICGDVEWGGGCSEANARLIAAAPELLAAAKEIALAAITVGDGCAICGADLDSGITREPHFAGCAVFLCEAAIAKAEGTTR